MRGLLLLPLLFCVAAGPTSREAAEPWLDRANQTHSAATKDAKQFEHASVNTAVILVKLRGNDADRRLLRRLLSLPVQRGEKETDNSWSISQVAYDTYGLIALGEHDRARAKLLRAEAIYAELKNKGDSTLMMDFAFMTLYQELGDAAQAAKWEAIAYEPFKPSTQEIESAFIRQWNAVRKSAREGDVEAVAAALKSADKSYTRVSLLNEAQRELLQRGQTEDARRLTVETVGAMETYKYVPSTAYSELAAICLEIGDRGAAIEMLRLADQDTELPSTHYWDLVALTAAKAGRAALFDRFLKRASNRAASPWGFTEQDRAKSHFIAAAGWVYLGHLLDAAEQFKAAAAIVKPAEYERYGFDLYAKAMIETDRLDEAVLLVEQALPDPDDRNVYLNKVARRHAEVGRFDQAWKVALQVTNRYDWVKIGLLRKLAKQEQQAGRTEALVARLPALTAKERTLVCLAVAELLLKREDLADAKAYDR